ncbi:hypothetical protein C8J56DRAFT_896774 [Mycena floridula]|nr:hypothetical protein C8J56DRAFT_896774 [Mycena floridula]
MSTALSTEQFCRGRANYPQFKENFVLAMEALGLDQILLGKLTKPLADPVQTTEVLTYNESGVFTGKVVTNKQVLSTIAGSSKPTIDEYINRERKANANLFACVINPRSYGLETTKSAAENWETLDKRLGKPSMTEQIIARDQLLSARFAPNHESKDEYDDYATAFLGLREAAVAAGGEYKDELLRITFIVSIDNEEYTNAASHIPVDATLEQTIATLRDTWLVRHQRKPLSPLPPLELEFALLVIGVKVLAQTPTMVLLEAVQPLIMTYLIVGLMAVVMIPG